MPAALITVVLLVTLVASSAAQTTATLQGYVYDVSGAVVPGATVSVSNEDSGFDRSVAADPAGRYNLIGIPAGSYRVITEATGFRSETIEELIVDVGRTIVRDFRLDIGNSRETVIVRAELPLVERASCDGRSRRHAADGAGDPAQRPSLHRPRAARAGVGRAVADRVFDHADPRRRRAGHQHRRQSRGGGRISRQRRLDEQPDVRLADLPAVDREHSGVQGRQLRVQRRSTGTSPVRSSSMVTRSGTDAFRGELFEFFRDDALDARNFFEFTSSEPHPFERHQFGGSIGGPFIRGRTFFFSAYEGMRQRQGLDMNSLVLSDGAARVGHRSGDSPARRFHPARQLRRRQRYIRDIVGPGEAIVDTDRWTIDVQHNLGANGPAPLLSTARSGSERSNRPRTARRSRGSGTVEPIVEQRPDARRNTRAAEPDLLNEVRFGRSGLRRSHRSAAAAQPRETSASATASIARSGCRNSSWQAGSTSAVPDNTRRAGTDASYILADTLQFTRGRHSVKTRRRVPAVPQRELRGRHGRSSTFRVSTRFLPEPRTRSASRWASDGTTSRSERCRSSFTTASASGRT